MITIHKQINQYIYKNTLHNTTLHYKQTNMPQYQYDDDDFSLTNNNSKKSGSSKKNTSTQPSIYSAKHVRITLEKQSKNTPTPKQTNTKSNSKSKK